MAIEALLFDLGKVLVDFNFDRGIRRFAARCSLPPERFADVLRNEDWIQRYETGAISSREYLQYLQDAGTLRMDLEEFHESWSSVFLPDPIMPDSLLQTLKQRYPMILVSNTNESHADFIAREYRVFHYFDHRILSHEVGSMKPDYRIYEAAIAAAGKPAESLFFTDDREENVRAARELGIRAHQFESVAGLLEAFRHYGINAGGFSEQGDSAPRVEAE
jgi:putative hydrolase of the HAD superfamily